MRATRTICLVAALVVARLGGLPGAPFAWRLDWSLPTALIAVALASLTPNLLLRTVRDIIRADRLLVSAIVFDALWTLASGARASDPSAAVREGLRAILPMAFFVAVQAARAQDPEACTWLRAAALASGAVSIALGVVGCVLGVAGHVTSLAEVTDHAIVGSWPRPVGSHYGPEAFGATALVTAGIAWCAPTRRSRWLAWAALVAAAGSLTIASIGAMALAIVWLTPSAHRRMAIAMAMALALLGAMRVYVHPHEIRCGVAIHIAPEPHYLPRGPDILPLHSVAFGPFGATAHVTGYAQDHAANIALAMKQPLGIGSGMFGEFDIGPTLLTSGTWSSKLDPHSLYLRRLSEGGWIGGLGAAFLLVTLIGRLRRAIVASVDLPERRRSLEAMLVMTLYSWFGDFLHRLDVALLALLLVGAFPGGTSSGASVSVAEGRTRGLE